MKKHGLVAAATLAIAFAGPVSADEVVYFTNGTAMSVRSHRVEKGMIRVELGNNAAMAFPVAMVEKVESSGRSIFPNSGSQANQAVAGSDGSAAPGIDPDLVRATAYGNVPSQFRDTASARRRAEMDPEQELALSQRGNPAPAPTAATRGMRIKGRTTSTVNEDGTYRRGDVNVIDMPGAPRSRGGDPRPPITSLEPALAPDPSAGDPPADPGSDSDADVPPES